MMKNMQLRMDKKAFAADGHRIFLLGFFLAAAVLLFGCARKEEKAPPPKPMEASAELPVLAQNSVNQANQNPSQPPDTSFEESPNSFPEMSKEDRELLAPDVD